MVDMKRDGEKPPHDWNVTIGQARRIQEKLAGRVRLSRLISRPRYVAGADVSSDRFGARLFAAACILDIADMSTVEEAVASGLSAFPYVPGLLSFREAPVVLEALKKLKAPFDVLLLDGQGLAHPRFFGLACHVGIWVGKPTIGCAKSLLVGECADPGGAQGSRSPLTVNARTVGAALRTREGAGPVYVSPGHMVDIESACEIVMACSAGCRLPDPIPVSYTHLTLP
ncbi:MAG: endonuclease V, partial [Planctomycetota bacterium]|nr:endonuclease V [Planctomycetota bacterium]